MPQFAAFLFARKSPAKNFTLDDAKGKSYNETIKKMLRIKRSETVAAVSGQLRSYLKFQKRKAALSRKLKAAFLML